MAQIGYSLEGTRDKKKNREKPGPTPKCYCMGSFRVSFHNYIFKAYHASLTHSLVTAREVLYKNSTHNLRELRSNSRSVFYGMHVVWTKLTSLSLGFHTCQFRKQKFIDRVVTGFKYVIFVKSLSLIAGT